MTTMTDSFDITIKVDAQRVLALLACALQGCAYWAVLSDVDAHGVTNLWEAPLTGGSLTFTAKDEPDKQLVLDRDAVERGLALFFNPATSVPGRHVKEFVDENEDAETGDVFLQLCLFGEIVYG